METMSTSQAYGGVGVAVDDVGTKQEQRSLVRSVFAWVWELCRLTLDTVMQFRL